MVQDDSLDDVKVAVMGCVVNGPGEAKEADIGIAGGIGEGLLIKKRADYKEAKRGRAFTGASGGALTLEQRLRVLSIWEKTFLRYFRH